MNTSLIRKIIVFAVILTLLVIAIAEAKENPGKKSSAGKTNTTQAAVCAPATAGADLDINNVRTRILAGGDMWWDLSNAKYEVPKGSGKHALFAGALWVGGVDPSGNVRVAAQTYRQTGNDYWPGPVDTTTVTISPSSCLFYDRHWKITRQQVADFVNLGTSTADILSWPGNGNAGSNEAHFLAPFEDLNGDGIYDPGAGDYPKFNFSNNFPPYYPGSPLKVTDDYLMGDQVVWWVMNDVGNFHTDTSSNPIGLEVRCAAYAYTSTDPVINTTTFYHYQLINRSNNSLFQTSLGQWVDPDLGNYADDYIGCNVPNGLGYCYNGDPDDNGVGGYGLNPPAVGVKFLSGPPADMNDGIDNDMDGCVDCSFIDSAGTIITVDDDVLREKIAFSNFMYIENINNVPTGNPNNYLDYYNYLRSNWLDGESLSYGGLGRMGSSGNTGMNCKYVYPGQSDPNYPSPFPNWTEGNNGNIPGDRRFVMSAGSFTFAPGQVVHFHDAVLFASPGSGGPANSVNTLISSADTVQQLFDNAFNPVTVGINEIASQNMVLVYPNPANGFVNFDSLQDNCETLRIYDTSGKLVFEKTLIGMQTFKWNTRQIPDGIYLYEFKTTDNRQTGGKILIRH